MRAIFDKNVGIFDRHLGILEGDVKKLLELLIIFYYYCKMLFYFG